MVCRVVKIYKVQDIFQSANEEEWISRSSPKYFLNTIELNEHIEDVKLRDGVSTVAEVFALYSGQNYFSLSEIFPENVVV